MTPVIPLGKKFLTRNLIWVILSSVSCFLVYKLCLIQLNLSSGSTKMQKAQKHYSNKGERILEMYKCKMILVSFHPSPSTTSRLSHSSVFLLASRFSI